MGVIFGGKDYHRQDYTFTTPPGEIHNIANVFDMDKKDPNVIKRISSDGLYFLNSNLLKTPEYASIQPSIEEWVTFYNSEEGYKLNNKMLAILFNAVYPIFVDTTATSLVTAWDFKQFPGELSSNADPVTKTFNFDFKTISKFSLFYFYIT